jgi:prepilin-type N-terminal cleavage/methylation domain-containing protein
MFKKLSEERGMTLVETMIALMVLLIGLMAMAQVLAFSVVASKTFGRDATKTTAFARDKMEELESLQFTDVHTNITVNPPYPTNGVGLTAGGGIPPTSPVAGYCDYLDSAGARTTSESALYTRQWQILVDAANVKRIIVAVTSNRSFRYGTAPSTVLVTQKTP